MRQSNRFFLIAGVFLLFLLFARQMGWVGEFTGFPGDAVEARKAEKLFSMGVCEKAKEFKSIKKFDVRRAYPKRAVRRGIEGRVSAMLRVDDAGKVLDVMVTSSEPSGAFSEAVEREAMKMVWEPAEPACKGKLREAGLQVEFKIDD